MLPAFAEDYARIGAPLGMDFVRARENSLERGVCTLASHATSIRINR